MNYDLHVGTILGLSGKVLVFCTTLIGASLPVTGFIIWWGKKKKGSKKAGKKAVTAKAENVTA
ncbi:PepSY-associated TM region [Filimonas lacunae]|uniref:PepSY-associated TM region n=2 Tax=Filimonas lacunae TaxID=477680 RepID=A0A173MKP1_9BACT|nr:PepSY-associated TM helix domain-containing protein [Filimonas lacunae]BAV07971.1 iron-regulated membrane protein [Filimonas lacunae]SIT07289.1 PepSY-associated TM region [Filimonas lacunae]